MTRIVLVLPILLALLLGCGGFTGRGRAVAFGHVRHTPEAPSLLGREHLRRP